MRLATTTDSTTELLAVAIQTREKVYRAGFEAGVDLDALRPVENESIRLFDNPRYEQHRWRMEALDQINEKFGRDRWRSGLGPSGQQNWKMKRDRLSACYTTETMKFSP